MWSYLNIYFIGNVESRPLERLFKKWKLIATAQLFVAVLCL